MDVRAYYNKVREIEAGLNGEHVVVISLATPEGGKAGVRTEAQRLTAARLIVEGRARIATDGESAEFHESHRAAKAQHDREAAAQRLQVIVVPHAESPAVPPATESRKQKDRS